MSTNDEARDDQNQSVPAGAELGEEAFGGPLVRERAFLEPRFTRLHPEGEAPRELVEPPSPGRPRAAEEGPLPTNFRRRLIEEYRQRQRQAAPQPPDEVSREAPLAPPANNWVPIGPSVVRQGQASNRPAVSGRVAGIAVAPGASRVYAASANGGVWRSDDGGMTWHSTMEAWDLNPTTNSSDSLACGAIAIDPADPDRVYVGTGEGASGAYFGVGPIRSDDGGVNWVTEPTAPDSPTLAGSAFYGLAMDPDDRERVVAATRKGIYRREPDGSGGHHWVRKQSGTYTGVVAVRGAGTTSFYAARWGGGVLRSTDGDAWTSVAAGFPTSNVGRVGLAVQVGNPDVVYALVARSDDYHLHGVYRLDVGDGTWRELSGAPSDLFGSGATGQGWYDLAIAVDPNDVNRIYLGGSTKQAGGQWSGCIYRCVVSGSGSGAGLTYSVTAQYIGATTHADIHALVFTPGESEKLWVGCDGGVFYTEDATGTSRFEARNVGLVTLTMNHLAQHPAEDAVLFCGTQDNGTTRYTGEEVWLHSAAGDGGFVVINWNDPYRVLRTYIRGYVYRATDGGQEYGSWNWVGLPSGHRDDALFYAPLAGTPPNPAAPAEAEIVAFGGRRPWISTTFGGGWQSIPNNDSDDNLPAFIQSLAFASATRLYAGTQSGHVYRFDKTGSAWARTQINTLGGDDALSLSGPITDIAVDPTDPSGGSIYVSFGGGIGDFRRVWHFDGTRWEARSGPEAGSADSLLDVQYNAIVVDPDLPSHVYAGADIGVWRSTDGGNTWSSFSSGLPDAAVLDLKLHNVRRLLRASTHGRGVYERTLDTETARGVELYVRDTQLDLGRRFTINGLDDPTQPGETVHHWAGPDIKVDVPSAMGSYQTPTSEINCFEYTDVVVDGSSGVATAAPTADTVVNRVYVQVHNRGVLPANDVRVMLLLANASAGLPDLPAGYETNLRTGTPISTPHWQTVGFQTLHDVRVGLPKIAAFDLPSTMLPPPANLAGNAHHCLLALIHCPGDDAFDNTETHVDTLSPGERKAAHKNLHVVQFAGTPEPAAPAWLAIRLHGTRERELLSDLVLELSDYPGRVRLLLPADLELMDDLEQSLIGLRPEDPVGFGEWSDEALRRLDLYAREERFRVPWCEEMLDAIEKVRGQPALAAVAGDEPAVVRRFTLRPGAFHTAFIAVDPPENARIGDTFEFTVYQRESEQESVLGGSSYRVEIVPEPDVEQDLNLEIWGKRWWFFGFEVLHVRLTDADGTVIGVDDGAEVGLHMHTKQGVEQELRSMNYHRGWGSFWLRVDRLPHLRPGVVQVTAVARVEGEEVARKTAEIRF